MILLYALVDDPAAAAQAWPWGTGGPPRFVTAGALTAIGTDCDGVPEPTPDALVAHDAVVTSLMGSCAVAPFRFPTVIAGTAGLAPALSGSEARMAALLDFLRGRVEMAVRAFAAPEPPTEIDGGGGPGRRYLHLVGQRSRPAGLDRLHRRLAETSVAACATDPGPGAMAASYLIGRDSVDGFRERVERVADDIPTVSMTTVTGPWAPYSFVTGTSLHPSGASPVPAVGGHRA